MASVGGVGCQRKGDVPGTLNSTTFLPFHSLEASYSCGRPQTVGSSSVMGAHLKHDHISSCLETQSRHSWPQYQRRRNPTKLESGNGYVLKLDALRERIANLKRSHGVQLQYVVLVGELRVQ
jgi:hypothetical protein